MDEYNDKPSDEVRALARAGGASDGAVSGHDRKARLLYELYDPKYGRRTYVDYNNISPLLLKATVAAEDHSFWQNSGVDFQGILRAIVANLQNQSVVQGGSTITQQLIKNQLFLDQPRTVQIKGEEALLAYGLTGQYPN